MKKWFHLMEILPAAAVGIVAVAGFKMSVPDLPKVIWPKEPDIMVEAKENTQQKKSSEESSETKAGIGNYTDGTFTGVGVGYGGKTTVSVTVNSKQITSVDVISNNDTPSYFNRAKNTVISEILAAQTWEVDSVSGATYSSRGIKEAVCNALTGKESDSSEGAGSSSKKASNSDFTMGDLKDGVFTGTAKGFGGTIKVSVTITGGKIKAIEVISHSGETPHYYNKATAIIKRIIKAQSPNVDVVSGATYSSSGIREAVKNALEKAKSNKKTNNDSSDSDSDSSDSQQPNVTIPDGTPADGTYTGTAQCTQNGRFNYQVTVSATYQDGKLVSLAYSTTDSGANSSYITKAWKGMESKLLNNPSGNTDVVSGATYTSNSMITAYKLAYKQAIEKNGGTVEDPAEEPTTTEKKSETTGGSGDNNREDISGTPADGSYTVSTMVNTSGSFVSYTLTGTVTFKDGKLTRISGLYIGNEPDDIEYEDDCYYLNLAKTSVINALIAKQSNSVDTVSGATYSSNGIISLYEKALKEAIAKNSSAKATTAPEKEATTTAATQVPPEASTEASTTERKEDTTSATEETTETTEATQSTESAEKGNEEMQ